jgi:hypothetical protein
MANINLRVVEPQVSETKEVDLRAQRRPERKVDTTITKVELSDNLKRFDEKVKVFKENPYSFNKVAEKDRSDEVPSTPTAFQMITNDTYNTVGKFLGVDTLHEWNKDYDKVYEIVGWAKKKSGAKDLELLIQWLADQANAAPSLSSNHRKIDQLYLYSKLQQK